MAPYTARPHGYLSVAGDAGGVSITWEDLGDEERNMSCTTHFLPLYLGGDNRYIGGFSMAGQRFRALDCRAHPEIQAEHSTPCVLILGLVRIVRWQISGLVLASSPIATTPYLALWHRIGIVRSTVKGQWNILRRRILPSSL
jgi:hypothetical protein